MNKTGYILGGMDLLTKHAENQKTNIYWTLIYIRDGIGMYLLESDLRPVNQGDLILLPPRVSYSFSEVELGDEYNANVDAVVLRFDNAWLADLLTVFRTMNKVVLKIREIVDPYAIEGPKWMKVSALLDELSKAGASRQAIIIIDLLELLSSPKDMVRILQSAQQTSLTLDERKEKIERYISTNLFDKVSLEEVAAYLGMNRTYFCLFFKRHYGKGFADYLNDLRVDKAASMLLQGDRQISEIAKECRFKTAAYFTRAFRRSRGMTPGEYRKTHSDR
jgi:AraC-like DNA-binding protein